MSHIRWRKGVEFKRITLGPETVARVCAHCERFTYISDHKDRYLHSLEGPLHVVSKVASCPDKGCAGHAEKQCSAADEMSIAPPFWSVSWDLFAWMGHRRFARHWSVPQILSELKDRFGIEVSADLVEDYVAKYEVMVAARESDVARLVLEYRDEPDVILSIDGLQPEKGHETLYVVRELRAQRVWFAEPLLSSAAPEIKRLFERARDMAARIGKPVRGWMSDKQAAFVSGVKEVFPDVPHRYCGNHFLRDTAKPVLEADSHAKVQMRRKVRGLRNIERRMLAEQPEPAATTPQPAPFQELEMTPIVLPAPPQKSAVATPVPLAPTFEPGQTSETKQVVLDYCAAVRGILNDDQGGPLHPPGVRMAKALGEVRDSIERAEGTKKRALCGGALNDLATCIKRGTEIVRKKLAIVAGHAEKLRAIQNTIDPTTGTNTQRRRRFNALATRLHASADPTLQHMARTMKSFRPGLFAGGDDLALPADNLDLERSFRLPKGHERRIHGHAHSGVRIVQRGPVLLLALDAHLRQTDPFTHKDLAPWRNANAPASLHECQRRRGVMRRARSTKKRPLLLADLERRYRSAILGS